MKVEITGKDWNHSLFTPILRVPLCKLYSLLEKKKVRESLQSKMAQAILSSYCTHLLQCILCPDQPSTMGSFLS